MILSLKRLQMDEKKIKTILIALVKEEFGVEQRLLT